MESDGSLCIVDSLESLNRSDICRLSRESINDRYIAYLITCDHLLLPSRVANLQGSSLIMIFYYDWVCSELVITTSYHR